MYDNNFRAGLYIHIGSPLHFSSLFWNHIMMQLHARSSVHSSCIIESHLLVVVRIYRSKVYGIITCYLFTASFLDHLYLLDLSFMAGFMLQ